MKKRETSTIITIIILMLMTLSAGIVLFLTNNIKYSVIPWSLCIVLFIYLIIYMNNTKSEEVIYKKEVSNIIKTYYSVLAEVKEFPDLNHKDVIRLNHLDDILNVQEETGKPIFYIINVKSVSFFTIDENVICIYTVKMNDSIVDPIEEKMFKKSKDLYISADDSALEDIENTTIIKIKDKFLKVTPVRGKDLEKTLIIPKLKD